MDQDLLRTDIELEAAGATVTHFGHERVGDEHVGERDVHGHHDRHLQ